MLGSRFFEISYSSRQTLDRTQRTLQAVDAHRASIKEKLERQSTAGLVRAVLLAFG